MKRLNIYAALGICMLILTACGGNAKKGSEPTIDEDTTIEQASVTHESADEDSNTVALEESKIDDFEYMELEDGAMAITVYFGDAEIVNIPEEINGAKVTSISGIAGKDNVIKVTIPDSVKVIERQAFAGAENLKEVVMGNNVEIISNCAFDHANKLEIINIPDSVTEIGEQAFTSAGIKSFTIPSGVSEIKRGTFALSDIESITIPSNVKVIGERAFEDCKKLSSVTIEEGVETIEKQAFDGDDSLKEIVLPASLTNIDGRLCKGVKIIAPAGSYAESYANECGYDFEAR